MSESAEQKIANLAGHYILCGAGRTGRNIIKRFCEMNTPFVVIEQDSKAIEKLKLLAQIYQQSLIYIEGDGTEDEILEQAGIRSAAGLFAALSDDKDNLFATLTARSLNPNLRIVTRVNDEKNNLEKLERAGANKVVSTDIIGGMRIASEMIRPEVVQFLDQMIRVTDKEKTLRFTELPVSKIKTPALVALFKESQQEDSPARVCIRDIGKYTGLLVVAIKSPDFEKSDKEDIFQIRKRYRFTLRGEVELQESDILVVIGTQDKLDEVTGTIAS